jgi:hypothetical protein
MSILIQVEGVLTNQVGQPIPVGEQVYRSLVHANRIVLSTNKYKADAERYVALRSLTDWANLRTAEAVLPGVDTYRRHIELERQMGSLDLVVSADPAMVEHCFKESVPAMLFAHPVYMVPEFRPDSEFSLRPWNDMVNEIEIRSIEAGKDERLKFEDVDLGLE